MDTKRIFLYAALVFVSYSLWNAWQIDYPSAKAPVQQQAVIEAEEKTKDDLLLPSIKTDSRSSDVKPHLSENKEISQEADAPVIQVQTDVLDLGIDLKQGNIIQAKLLDYPVSIEKKDQPVNLLYDDGERKYVANSALLSLDGGRLKPLDIRYTSESPVYKLSEGEKTLTVRLQGETADGLKVEKIFRFEQGSYLVHLSYHVNNSSPLVQKIYLNTQLLRSSPEEDKSSIFHVGSYTGASFSSPGKQRYQKVSFSEMSKHNMDETASNGWIAMQQHYFLSAWIPQANEEMTFYTRSKDSDYSIGAVSQPMKIEKNAEKSLETKLYIGPEITSQLNAISPTLGMTVDYGMLWFLSSGLFWIMSLIYQVVGNWGWAIVLVTVLVKAVFYRLSAASYRSMAGMRKLQPKLLAIRERYGDDKAKISQATMELYKQEKINPLGGCLPIVIQIPVFIALYWVLLESVELRQAPFILWIHDLASADPYHVLPLIMGSTMLIQQKLNPAPPDPVQAKVMMFLPLMFTALFWNFPAGLVLYWIVNNSLSILQQWYITKKHSDNSVNDRKKLVAANK